MTLTEIVQKTAAVLRTQKAKGLIALRDAGLNVGKFWIAQTLDEALTILDEVREPFTRGVFMRPCPKLPRPGFVDSRLVRSSKDAEQVWNEAVAADPDAECILMPFTESCLSLAYTSGLLSIGPDHDGATAGKSSIAVPVPPYAGGCYAFDNALKASGVLSHPDPAQRHAHVEAVIATGGTEKPRWVQIRAGAAASGAGDWIPFDVKLAEIVNAPEGHDPALMLQWEVTAKKLAGRKDLVVWAPGSTQGSHTALHCKNNNLPITFNEKAPVVGSTLKATVGAASKVDPMAVMRGVAAGIAYPWRRFRSHADALRVMLIGLHGYSPTPEASFWLGFSAALYARLAAAACLGETRHATKKVLGKTDRAQVYEQSFLDWWTTRANMPGACESFAYHHWGGSFGGKKWLEIALATTAVDNSMRDLAKGPTAAKVNTLVSTLNAAVNLAHNCGWSLNKFGKQSLLDEVAKGHPTTVVDAAADLFHIHDWARSNVGLREALAAAERLASVKVLRTEKDKDTLRKVASMSNSQKPKLGEVPPSPAAAAAALAQAQAQQAAAQQAQQQYAEQVAAAAAKNAMIPLGHITQQKNVPTPGASLLAAQAKVSNKLSEDKWVLHIQFKTSQADVYHTIDVVVSKFQANMVNALPLSTSYAGGGTVYHSIPVVNAHIALPGVDAQAPAFLLDPFKTYTEKF
jgi:hypothetical protein